MTKKAIKKSVKKANEFMKTKTEKLSKLIIVCILLAFCAVNFSACKLGNTEGEHPGNNGKISVCTSFYVMYDFAGKIGGDKVILKNLLPAGADPHSWEPSPKDIVSIEKADILIYNGAGMEGWIDKVLESISNTQLITVETSKDIKLLEAKHNTVSENHDGHEHIYDPHVWLDPMKAKIQIRAIADAFIKVDPSNKDYYEKNYEHYVKELVKLDDEYRETVSRFKKKDIIVSHEAFGYLCNAYGLNQIAISGLDTESEPTSARMVDVAKFAKDNNVKVIFFDKMVTPKIADAIAKSAGAETEVLNPIASLSTDDIKAGKDYFSAMRENLEALKKALS